MGDFFFGGRGVVVSVIYQCLHKVQFFIMQKMGWNWMTEGSVICLKEHVCCLFFPQNWHVLLSSCEILVCCLEWTLVLSLIQTTLLPKVFGSVFLLLLWLLWMQDYGACLTFFILIFFAFLQTIMLCISFTSCSFSATVFIPQWMYGGTSLRK